MSGVKWENLKKCPQCGSPLKIVEEIGVRYACGSLIHILGKTPGTLTSTGICATLGRKVFDQWADKYIERKVK